MLLSFTLLPFYPFTLLPFYPFTLLPFYPFTLLPFYPFTLLPFYPFTLLPFYPFTLLPFYPFTLLPFYSFTLLLFYSFTLLLFYSFTLLPSNTGPYLYEHHALPTELTDHLIQMYSKFNYLNYLKRESDPNKKGNLVRISLEHRTLPLLAPRSTNWANGPLDTNVLQI